MTVPDFQPIAATELITDEDIVARVLGGDAALFEILMRRYNQRVYRAVVAVLGRDEHAEDVMQEAYLRAYEHLGQFEGRAQFSTWLTRIAVNAAIARRRSGKREWQGEDETMMALVETDSPDPEEQTMTAELREVLEREMARLRPEYRTVLMMREIEGLSTAETAASLDISEDLVKTRLHRARTMLRDRLFKRAGMSFESLFTFGSSRCDRVVCEVMERIAGQR